MGPAEAGVLTAIATETKAAAANLPRKRNIEFLRINFSLLIPRDLTPGRRVEAAWVRNP